MAVFVTAIKQGLASREVEAQFGKLVAEGKNDEVCVCACVCVCKHVFSGCVCVCVWVCIGPAACARASRCGVVSSASVVSVGVLCVVSAHDDSQAARQLVSVAAVSAHELVDSQLHGICAQSQRDES